MLTLQRFTMNDDAVAFHGYRRLKRDVFIAEQGWALAVDPTTNLAAVDEADAKSCFVLAHDASGAAVGVVRGTLLSAAFPHRDFLEHHLQRGGISMALPQMATINALAVRRDLRGVPVAVAGCGRPMTAGKALMVHVVDWLREQGVLAVVLTTIKGVPGVFFEHLGCYVMDPLFRVAPADFDLINMALLTVDPERYQEQRSPLGDTCPRRELTGTEQACRAYCRARHAAILGGRTIEQLVGFAPRAASAASTDSGPRPQITGNCP